MADKPISSKDNKDQADATDKTKPPVKPGETTLSLRAVADPSAMSDANRRIALNAMRGPDTSGLSPLSIGNMGEASYDNIAQTVSGAGLQADTAKGKGPFVVSQVADGKVVGQQSDATTLKAPTTLKPGDGNMVPAGWIQYPPGPAPAAENLPVAEKQAVAGPPQIIDQGIDATGQHNVQTKNADGSYVTRDTNQNPPRVTAEKDSAGRESKFVYNGNNLVEVDNATGKWKQGNDGTWTNEKGDKFNGSITVNNTDGSFNYADRSTGINTTWKPDGSHQVQFKDGTKFDGKDFDASGKATIVENGKSTAYSLDGTKTVTNSDKSTIQTDSNGRVTAMTTADNKSYQFQYDANGTPTGVQNQYGWWHSTDGGNTWTNDTDKTKVQGHFNVTADGAYSFVSKQGPNDKNAPTETRTTDGRVTIIKGDGTSVSTSPDGASVTKDSLGRPTLVTTSNNEKYSFKYDGSTTTFTNGKGDWVSTDGQNWALKSDATQTYKGTINVDSSGNLVQTDAGTGIKHVTQHDGSQLEVHTDGSSVQRDSNNRIIKETDAAGHGSQFTYNADGTIASTTNDSGTWTTKDGTSWTNGKDSWSGSIGIDQLTGTTVYQDSTGVKQIAGLDGTKAIENPDGSKVSYDRSGHLVQTTDARGQVSNYTYNGDQLTNIQSPSGNFHSTDGGATFTDGTKTISQVKLDSEGNLSYKDSASNSTVQGVDGSIVQSNKNGAVTDVVDGAGKHYSYTYDASTNALTSFTTPTGKFTTTDGGKTYTNGSQVLNDVGVDSSGTLNYRDSAGTTTRSHADGSSFILKADSSSISTNKNGQVTDIYDANGNHYSFGYDAKGNLNQVTNLDGHWTANDASGTSWTNTDTKATWQGQISVKPDGTYSFTNNFGDKTSVDIKTGDITTKSADGSTHVQGVDTITGDKYLKSSTDAAGHAISYGYDANGKLNSVTDGSNVYTTKDGTTWTAKDGSVVKDVTVGTNGMPQFTDANGLVHSHQTDGSQITATPDGRVQQIVDSAGKTTNFAYDSTGLQSITTTGATYTRDANGTFADNSNPPRTFNVRVNADGSQNWQSSDGNTQLTIRSNGSQFEINTENGNMVSTINRDTSGRVTSVVNSNYDKSNVTYGADGKPSVVTGTNGTWTLGKDGTTWTNDSGQPAFKGTISVDSKGNEIFTDSTSKVVTTYSADGSKLVVNANGSSIATSAHGDSTTYTHAPVNGTQTQVTIGADGGVQVKNGADGSVLTQAAGSNTFTLTDANGNVLQTGNGSISVDRASGTTTISNSDTGGVQVLRAEGTGQSIVRNSDGIYTDSTTGRPVTVQQQQPGVISPPAQQPAQAPTAPSFGPRPTQAGEANLSNIGSSTVRNDSAAPVLNKPIAPSPVATPDGGGGSSSSTQGKDTPAPVVNNGPPVAPPAAPTNPFIPPTSKIVDSNTVGLVASSMRVDPPPAKADAPASVYGSGGPGAAQVVESISTSAKSPELFKPVTPSGDGTSGAAKYAPIDYAPTVSRSEPAAAPERSSSSSGGSGAAEVREPAKVDPVKTETGGGGSPPPPEKSASPTEVKVAAPTEVKSGAEVPVKSASAEPTAATEKGTTSTAVDTKATVVDTKTIDAKVTVTDTAKGTVIDASPGKLEAPAKLDAPATTRTDATSSVLAKDAAPANAPVLEKDQYGHVTSITDSVGNKTNIEYSAGPNGQPVKVSDATGSTVYTLSADGKTWTSNAPGAPPFKGTLTVDATGKQTWTDSATQAFKTISPDGSQMIVKADGSRVAISPDHQSTTYYLAPVNGKVTEVTVNPNGTEIKNADGYLLRQANNGNVLTVYDPKGNVVKETTGTVTIDNKTGMVTINPLEKVAATGTPVQVVPGLEKILAPIMKNTNGEIVTEVQPTKPVQQTGGAGGTAGGTTGQGGQGQSGGQSNAQGTHGGPQGNQGGQPGNQAGPQGNQGGQPGNQAGPQGNQAGPQGNQAGPAGNQGGPQGNQLPGNQGQTNQGQLGNQNNSNTGGTLNLSTNTGTAFGSAPAPTGNTNPSHNAGTGTNAATVPGTTTTGSQGQAQGTGQGQSPGQVQTTGQGQTTGPGQNAGQSQSTGQTAIGQSSAQGQNSGQSQNQGQSAGLAQASGQGQNSVQAQGANQSQGAGANSQGSGNSSSQNLNSTTATGSVSALPGNSGHNTGANSATNSGNSTGTTSNTGTNPGSNAVGANSGNNAGSNAGTGANAGNTGTNAGAGANLSNSGANTGAGSTAGYPGSGTGVAANSGSAGANSASTAANSGNAGSNNPGQNPGNTVANSGLNSSSNSGLTSGNTSAVTPGGMNSGNASGANSGNAGGVNSGNAGGMNSGNSGASSGNSSGLNSGTNGGANSGNASGMNSGNTAGMNSGTAGGNAAAASAGSNFGANQGSGSQGTMPGHSNSGVNSGNTTGMNSGPASGPNFGSANAGGTNAGNAGGVNTVNSSVPNMGNQGGVNAGTAGGANSGGAAGTNIGNVGGVNSGNASGAIHGSGAQGTMSGNSNSGVNSGNTAGVNSGNAGAAGNALGPNSGNASGPNSGNASGPNSGNASGPNSGNASGPNSSNASGMNSGNASGMNSGNAAGSNAGTASGAPALPTSGLSKDPGGSASSNSGLSNNSGPLNRRDPNPSSNGAVPGTTAGGTPGMNSGATVPVGAGSGNAANTPNAGQNQGNVGSAGGNLASQGANAGPASANQGTFAGNQNAGTNNQGSFPGNQNGGNQTGSGASSQGSFAGNSNNNTMNSNSPSTGPVHSGHSSSSTSQFPGSSQSNLPVTPVQTLPSNTMPNSPPGNAPINAGPGNQTGTVGQAGNFQQGNQAGTAGQAGNFQQGNQAGTAGQAGNFQQGNQAGTAGQAGNFQQGNQAGTAGQAGNFQQGNQAGSAGQVGNFQQANQSGTVGQTGNFQQGNQAGTAGHAGNFQQGNQAGTAGQAGNFQQGNQAGTAGQPGNFQQGNQAGTVGQTGNFQQGNQVGNVAGQGTNSQGGNQTGPVLSGAGATASGAPTNPVPNGTTGPANAPARAQNAEPQNTQSQKSQPQHVQAQDSSGAKIPNNGEQAGRNNDASDSAAPTGGRPGTKATPATGSFDSASTVSSTSSLPFDPTKSSIPLNPSVPAGFDPGLPSGFPTSIPGATDPSMLQNPNSLILPPGQVDFSVQPIPEIPLHSIHFPANHGHAGHKGHDAASHIGMNQGGSHTGHDASHHVGHGSHNAQAHNDSGHHPTGKHDSHSSHEHSGPNQHAAHHSHDQSHAHSHDNSNAPHSHNTAHHGAGKHNVGDHHHPDALQHLVNGREHTPHQESRTHRAENDFGIHDHANRIETADVPPPAVLPPSGRIDSAEQLDTSYQPNLASFNINEPGVPNIVSTNYEEQIRLTAQQTIREMEEQRQQLQSYNAQMDAARRADEAQSIAYQQTLADRKETAEQLDADYRASLDEQRGRLDEDRERREEEDKRRKQEEEARRLSDTMLTAMTTKRQQEIDEQVRNERLREEQIRREEEIRQDTKQETYIVKPKDMLESITKKKLGSLELLDLVYELNKTKIQIKYAENGKPLYIVKPGTVLHLPSRKQIREFKQRKLSQSANNMRAAESPALQFDPTRRANVEAMLGPVSAPRNDDAEVIKYTVRLGDSLRSVAMKHPALLDITLWKLVARKNGLSITTDSKGAPTASLRRGSQIVIPSSAEIAAFRLTTTGDNIAALKNGQRTELVTTECPSCRRLVTASSTVCPACAFPLATAEISEDGQTRAISTSRIPQTKFTDADEAVYGATKLVSSDKREEASVVAEGTTSGAESNSENLDTTLRFNNSILKFGRSKDSESALSFAARRLEFEVGNVLSFGPPTGATTLTFAHERSNGTPSVRVEDEVTESTIEQLSDICRMLKSSIVRQEREIARSQLEVMRDSEWVPILAYEVSDASTMRHEYLANGTKRSISIDLPASAATEMIQNDLASNWLSYSKKFLAGKRLTA